MCHLPTLQPRQALPIGTKPVIGNRVDLLSVPDVKVLLERLSDPGLCAGPLQDFYGTDAMPNSSHYRRLCSRGRRVRGCRFVGCRRLLVEATSLSRHTSFAGQIRNHRSRILIDRLLLFRGFLSSSRHDFVRTGQNFADQLLSLNNGFLEFSVVARGALVNVNIPVLLRNFDPANALFAGVGTPHFDLLNSVPILYYRDTIEVKKKPLFRKRNNGLVA